MGNVTFSIEGLYRGQWTTLFAGLARRDAKEKLQMLQERNPACRYRLSWQAHESRAAALAAAQSEE